MLPIQSAMTSHAASRTHKRGFRVFVATSLAGLLGILAPATSPAAMMTIGSPLSVPATLNTSTDLSYLGTYTQVPRSPEAPNGVFHTPHYGADTALWNVAQAAGHARVPATGQVLKVSLEGCAQAARNGPAPNTQIHFQDLSPLPGGGAEANITAGPFNIPICGQGGAGASTVTTYEPVRLCVGAGDYVDFNDEGGYVENVYRSGVPYQVLGAVRGSMADSFLADNGTGNGAIFSPLDTAANDGFASNQGEELMLQVELGTGPDATFACPGGTRGKLAPVGIRAQTDGVNHQRIVAVAIYCRVSPACKGVASLSTGRGHVYGRSGFSLQANRTSHLPIRVASALIDQIRKHGGVSVAFSVLVGGRTFTRAITVKIF